MSVLASRRFPVGRERFRSRLDGDACGPVISGGFGPRHDADPEAGMSPKLAGAAAS